MRKDWDDYFFDIARVVASRATCPRRQVGCVIVSDRRILSTGYNGAPSGHDHCIDVGCSMQSNHCTRAVHAEENSILQLVYTMSQYQLDNITNVQLYCTLQPCNKCMQLINSVLPFCKIKWLEDYENV